jgi:RHS repeat-associated protein
VGVDNLPDLSLPKTVLSSVDNIIGEGGVAQASPDNLTLYNLGVRMRLLGGTFPHDELLGSDMRVLSSMSFWQVEAQVGLAWHPLLPTSNNFTLLGTTKAGTSVVRTMEVRTGAYSGVLRIVYKALSSGALKWDLVFTAGSAGQYRLAYSWWNTTSVYLLEPVVKKFETTYASATYTLSWGDLPSSTRVSTSITPDSFLLSVDLGAISAGSRVIVDPSIVSSNVAPGATAYSFQRKIFYEPKGGYYWAFYYDGYQELYRNSKDGVIWSGSNQLPGNLGFWQGAAEVSLPSVTNLGQTVAVAKGQIRTDIGTAPYSDAVGVAYAIGNIAGSTISWGVVQYSSGHPGNCQTTSGTSCTMTLETRFVSAAFDVYGGLHFAYNLVYQATAGVSPCGSQTTAESDVMTDYNALYCGNNGYTSNMRAVVLPSTNPYGYGIVYQYYNQFLYGSAVHLAYGFYSSCLCPFIIEEIDGGLLDSQDISAVSDTNYGTHVAYKMANGNVNYAFRAASNSSSAPITVTPNIFSASAASPTLTLDSSTNDIYALAIQGSSLMMRRKPLAQSWSDNLIMSPIINRNNPANLGSNYVSASATNSSQVLLFWTEGTGPYNATFASIPIQTVWSPYSSPSDPWDGNGLAPYGQYFANLGEYVSPSTGMLTIRQTDLSVPGRGLSLDITRVYTEPYSFLNNAPYNYESYPWAPIGDGWQLNFPWLNNITYPLYLHLWNGEAFRIPYSFWNGPTAVYENHQGEHFRLVRNSNGSINLYDKSGVLYGFDSYHRLVEVADTLTGTTGISFIYFNYASNSYNSPIASITDTVGRLFVFCYNNGLLHSINQTMGNCSSGAGSVRGVVFSQNGQNLASVADPANRITAYSYGSNPWLLTQITYPTRWYDRYSYTGNILGTTAISYRVSLQQTSASSTSTIRQFAYSYTQDAGDQITGSTVTSYNGTQIASRTKYAFSFIADIRNVTDASGNLLNGDEQFFGVNGQIPRNVVFVTDGQGHIGSYTNYYSYDLWGNLIYSRNTISSSPAKSHENFNAYYNNGVPPGFNAFQETFSQGNYTLPDNPWSTFNGTWLVKNGLYSGTETSQVGDSVFAWANISRADLSLQAKVSVTRPVDNRPGYWLRFGIFTHFSTSVYKWALVIHTTGSPPYLELLDEWNAWLGDTQSSARNACSSWTIPLISYGVWFTFNMTVHGNSATGWVSAPGQSPCSVSGTFSSSSPAVKGMGFGLYSGGYSTLFDNVTATTVTPGITGTSFSNSFFQNGSPNSNIHGSLAGRAELENGAGTLPIETYYSYYGWGGLNQQRIRNDQSGSTQWPSTSRTYDTYGNPATVTDALGNYTYYTYSGMYGTAYLTNETSVLKPGSSRVSRLYSYNFTDGTMLSGVDPKGYNTTYKFDIVGRVVKVTYPNDNFVSYAYNDAINYVNATNENGWLTQKRYDGLARLSTVNRFVNGKLYSNSTYAFNWQDKTVASKDQVGNTYLYVYDALGRLTSSTTPDGKSVILSYNDFESWSRTKDQDGNYRCAYYDRLGRLISVVEYADSNCIAPILNGVAYVTNYSYDEVGNLRTVTNAATKSTSYYYTNLNRLTSINYSDGTSENYTYDNNGNTVSKINRNNVQTNYSYDSLNRLSTIIYPGITFTPDNYTYDPNGNLLKLTSQNATLTYIYDSRNRVTGETYSINGGHVNGPLGGPTMGPSVPPGTFSSGYSFTYGYTGETLAQITYSDFMTAGYSYDGLGRVAGVRIATATYHPNATTFSYYPNDKMKGIAFANGLMANYTYDSLSRPVQITLKNSTNTFFSLAYGYNNTGTVNSVIGQVNRANLSERYCYDPLRRLTNAVLWKGATTILSYQYDGVGNRRSQTTNGASTITYSYNPANNQLTSSTSNSSSYAYNPDGSLKQWNYTLAGAHTNTYAWDVPGNLVRFFHDGSFQGSYAYDGLGRRVETVESSTETFYAYLGTETLADFGTSGAGNNYVYANGLRIARVNGAWDITPTVVYYHEDALGSTRLVTSSTKTVLFSDSYQPYGLDNGATGSETYKFTGKPVSQTTGLYYDYHRWYDPSLGRFISPDPKRGHLTNPQSLNLYIYALNLPTGITDPTGEDGCWIFSSICNTVSSGASSTWNTLSTGASNLYTGTVNAWNGLSPEEKQGILIVGMVALTVATGGAAAPLLIGAGLAVGAGAVGVYAGYSYATSQQMTLSGALTAFSIGFAVGSLGAGLASSAGLIGGANAATKSVEFASANSATGFRGGLAEVLAHTPKGASQEDWLAGVWDVANNPTSWTTANPGGGIRAYGLVDDSIVRVVIGGIGRNAGKIVTAFRDSYFDSLYP